MLNLQQSVARHLDELAARGIARRGSFESVIRTLGDDRRRRRLSWCLAEESPREAADLAFGGSVPAELSRLHPAHAGLAPVWDAGADSWAAAVCVKSPDGLAALVSLPPSGRAAIREVTLASRADAMTSAIAEHAARWSFPALTSLEVRGGRDAAGAVAALVRRCPSLQRLAVAAAGADGGLVDALAELPSLTQLELLVAVDGDHLASKLIGALRRVSLQATDVTPRLADAIASSPSLAALSVRASRIKKTTFKQLAKKLAAAHRLEELRISGCELLDGKTLEAIAPLSTIRHLRVQGRGLDGLFLSKLEDAELEELDLDGVSMKAAETKWLVRQASLARLRLAECNLKGDTVRALAKLPRLAVLDLDGGRLADVLPALAGMPSLFRLRLPLFKGQEAALVDAPVPERLRELDIDSVDLSPREASALAKWPLEALNVGSNALYDRPVHAQLGSAGAKELARCASLEWLHVGAHRIGGEGARALATLPRLRWLHLTQNPIGDGVVQLEGAPALRVVYLDGAGLRPDAPRSLAKIQTLEEVFVWDNQIDGRSLDQFVRLKHLRELNLANNPIPREQADALRKLLPHANVVA